MKYFLTLCFCLFIAFSNTAQSIDRQLIGTSSGLKYGQGMQIEWSVGETFIGIYQPDFGLITEGFIQPFIIADIDLANNLNTTNKEFSLETYPNPVSGKLTMKLAEPNDAYINVTVFDFIGKKVFNDIIPAGTFQQDLDMSGLADGIYVVRFFSPQMEFRTSVKVIKAKS